MTIKRDLGNTRNILKDSCCEICGNDNGRLASHRIIPGRIGGKYTVENTVTLCGSCDNKVHQNYNFKRKTQSFEDSFEQTKGEIRLKLLGY